MTQNVCGDFQLEWRGVLPVAQPIGGLLSIDANRYDVMKLFLSNLPCDKTIYIIGLL